MHLLHFLLVLLRLSEKAIWDGETLTVVAGAVIMLNACANISLWRLTTTKLSRTFLALWLKDHGPFATIMYIYITSILSTTHYSSVIGVTAVSIRGFVMSSVLKVVGLVVDVVSGYTLILKFDAFAAVGLLLLCNGWPSVDTTHHSLFRSLMRLPNSSATSRVSSWAWMSHAMVSAQR